MIVLHPGSGSLKKVWPLGNWADLAGRLRQRYGRRILVVLGPADPPEINKAFDGVETVTGLSILRLASVIEGCGFFIGNDSGVSHLSAAIDSEPLPFSGLRIPRRGLREEKRSGWSEIPLPVSPCFMTD